MRSSARPATSAGTFPGASGPFPSLTVQAATAFVTLSVHEVRTAAGLETIRTEINAQNQVIDVISGTSTVTPATAHSSAARAYHTTQHRSNQTRPSIVLMG